MKQSKIKLNSTSEFAIRKKQNLHLVLIGDSLTRYMYLSLVNYLENGNWDTTFQTQDKSYNIIHEKSFENWTHFYNFTNNIFHKREICDCYRNSTQFEILSTRENRFYQDPSRANYVSYIQKFGNLSSKGMT